MARNTEKDPIAERQKEIEKLNQAIAEEREKRTQQQANTTQTIQLAQLDVEKARLESVLAEEQAITARSSPGGGVEDARSAMEAAQQATTEQNELRDAARKEGE